MKLRAQSAIDANLKVILCVGESLIDRENESAHKYIEKQLNECLPNNFENSLIAYEPIWAIGTGLTPSISEIDEVHKYIKNISDKFKNFRVIYGGSVKASNSSDINSLDNVDGCLIGGSSLKVDEFNRIIS